MKTVSVVVFAGLVACVFAGPIEAVKAATFHESVLHSFSGGGTDGAYPEAGVIDVKGTLYGTTVWGTGDGDRGTVFAVDPTTGAETVVYSFCGKRSCEDGFNPEGGLIEMKGKLYGTTESGGRGFDGQHFGTAFRLDPDRGTEKVLYSFCQQQGCPDGMYPSTSLLAMNGTLYGTTKTGGGSGTAFAIDPKTGAETVVYDFCSQKGCIDGADPLASLVAANGTLYGTTLSGGADDCGNGQACGTVFSLDPSSGVETVLHSFGSSTDGKYPEAGVIDVDGFLYGTTDAGGDTGCFGGYGCGTVFSVDPVNGTEAVLYAFCSLQNCADGAQPFASLTDVDGTLYGTTYEGGGTGCGGSGCGTVFSVDPATGAETVVYAFSGGPDGANPVANLIAVKGKLYGTTEGGGAYGYGTVFELGKMR
jgi:uncharacterized repeat protein (TIGR03803 family)